jgi:hypothetical protein
MNMRQKKEKWAGELLHLCFGLAKLYCASVGQSYKVFLSTVWRLSNPEPAHLERQGIWFARNQRAKRENRKGRGLFSNNSDWASLLRKLNQPRMILCGSVLRPKATKLHRQVLLVRTNVHLGPSQLADSPSTRALCSSPSQYAE